LLSSVQFSGVPRSSRRTLTVIQLTARQDFLEEVLRILQVLQGCFNVINEQFESHLGSLLQGCMNRASIMSHSCYLDRFLNGTIGPDSSLVSTRMLRKDGLADPISNSPFMSQ